MATFLDQVFEHKILGHFVFSKYEISVERKSSLKNLKYKITNRQLKKFIFLIWRKGMWKTILKRDHPSNITGKSGLIWFSSFRGEDLNVISYKNMFRYKSTDSNV